MSGNLRFEFAAASESVAASGPVPVTFRLVNAGDEPVVVNRRLAVTGGTAVGEIQLSGARPDGGAVPFIADVNVGRPRPDHFATLASGGVVERDDDLRRYLLLDEPGEYRIRAVYHNRSAGADGLAAVAWTGELPAEPLRLMR